MGEMRVMGIKGDTRISWDPTKKVEVKVARKTFERLIKEGYTAFEIGKNNEKSSMVAEFDPESEKLIFVPQIRGG